MCKRDSDQVQVIVTNKWIGDKETDPIHGNAEERDTN